jgi:hypothetical protein
MGYSVKMRTEMAARAMVIQRAGLARLLRRAGETTWGEGVTAEVVICVIRSGMLGDEAGCGCGDA